jgi:predicted phosphohydrolase
VLSLYAIGDLHLSLGTDKPMDVFGDAWKNYTQKIEKGFSILTDDDLCVICGDISWAMSLEESLNDFLFIDKLPGRKCILKGNHDYWWSTVTKMKSFFDKNGITSIDILHNNCIQYNDIAICGTRGWIIEGAENSEHNQKIISRETARLRTSLQNAGDVREKLCFFHYPPRYQSLVCQAFIDLMNEFSVKRCWYGHIHSQGHKYAVQGEVEGIIYQMVSADYIDFTPVNIICN